MILEREPRLLRERSGEPQSVGHPQLSHCIKAAWDALDRHARRRRGAAAGVVTRHILAGRLGQARQQRSVFRPFLPARPLVAPAHQRPAVGSCRPEGPAGRCVALRLSRGPSLGGLRCTSPAAAGPLPWAVGGRRRGGLHAAARRVRLGRPAPPAGTTAAAAAARVSRTARPGALNAGRRAGLSGGRARPSPPAASLLLPLWLPGLAESRRVAEPRLATRRLG